jgi:Flp pilus assembly protein TadD/predicted Ser/Thr protein kinase
MSHQQGATEAYAIVGRTVADGRYEIVKLLGEGGMGAVYQARQVAMDRMVALKLIRAEVVKSPDAVARFYREMKITAKIEHANTIRVYDFGETDGQLFLTMELLKGQTLKRALETGGKMPLDRIVHIATQITRALAAAHGEGVVHRDLKPDNVMLLEQYGERDVVKVLDFGIAKSLEDTDQPQMTAAGAVIGTPVYMSAEQAMGQKVDTRADIYSLGVMLFEMASGRVPFTAPTLNALLVAHAVEPPPPLLEVAPDAHPQLAALIAQMLEKSPVARPQTAKEVEQRLLALVGGHVTIPPTRIGMEGAPTPSRTGLIAAIAGALVLAAGGAGFFVYKSRQAGGGGPKPLSAEEQAKLDGVTKRLDALELPPVPSTCEEGAAVGEILLQAQSELKTNDAHALALAKEAAAKCPSWAAAHNVLGRALQGAGQLKEAADAYARAVGFAPTWDAPRFNLGTVQATLKDPTALATLNELIGRRPDYKGAYTARAQAHLNAQNVNEAMRDLDEALRRDDKDGLAWYLKGKVLAATNGGGDAHAAYCRASELGIKPAEKLCKK